MEKIIVANKDLSSGHILDEDDIALKIPDNESSLDNTIEPDKYYEILGKKIKTQLKEDDPIKINFIE